MEESVRDRLAQEGVTTVVEVGPGTVLSGLVRKIAKGTRVLNVDSPQTLEATAAALANLMSLKREAARHAIAITTVANVPMRNTRAGQLSMWKGVATAYAVRNAVFGVQLDEGQTLDPDLDARGPK